MSTVSQLQPASVDSQVLVPESKNFEARNQLRPSLPDCEVLLPGDKEYDGSLKRWNAGCEKRAVSPRCACPQSQDLRLLLTQIVSCREAYEC